MQNQLKLATNVIQPYQPTVLIQGKRGLVKVKGSITAFMFVATILDTNALTNPEILSNFFSWAIKLQCPNTMIYHVAGLHCSPL